MVQQLEYEHFPLPDRLSLEAVLGVGPINSALRAVQASIMADEPTAG
jgi:hypothetical protein